MTAPLSGKNVMLTGAGSGIGRHLVGVLSGLGYRVLATDLDLAKLNEASHRDRWQTECTELQALDVRDAAQWTLALDWLTQAWGPLDILLNVAGYLNPGRVFELEPADVDRHFDINVKGVIHGTRLAGARMVAQRSGHIITIGSLASLAPIGGLTLYAASKFAVRGFCLSAAQDLAPHNVAVSLVMPDAVQTPMLELQVNRDEAAMTFSGQRPLSVDDIGRVLVEEVLPHRPLEITCPPFRGFLARLANLAPETVMKMTPLFVKRGRKNQAKARLQKSEE
jgi:3-oxoacyl-[acyl-carrier protein] reductase